MYITNQFQTPIYQPNFQSRKVSLSKLEKELASGMKKEEIAKQNNISLGTLYNRIKRFNLLSSTKELKAKKEKEAIALLEKDQLTQKKNSLTNRIK